MNELEVAKAIAADSECCPGMELALERGAALSTRPAGLEKALAQKRGTTGFRIIYRLPRGKRGDKSPMASATWIDVKFCPFCGKEVAQ